MITVLLAPKTLGSDESPSEGPFAESSGRETVELVGDTYRHLFRSRRVAVGASLRFVDGAGAARWGVVETVDRRRAVVRLEGAAPLFEPRRRVVLLTAPPKLPRASWLVEKATELGVEGIRFLATERSSRGFGPRELERLERVAAAALEQSHGSRLPRIDGPHELDAALSLAPREAQRWILETPSEDASGPPVARPPSEPSSASVAAVLAIGPEGGWTDDESRRLRAASFRPLTLGPRILRIETAAIVAAAAALEDGFGH